MNVYTSIALAGRLAGWLLAVAVIPSLVSAQERELPLDSLENAVELEQVVGDLASDFTVSGFGVGAFSFESAGEENTLAATKLAISVFKRAGPYLSFFGQLTTLLESEGIGGLEEEQEVVEEGGEEESALETEIDNLILSFTPPGAAELTFWLGRFDAPFGFERDDEPLNFQPTTSFNFGLARPVKLSGLLARYTPAPLWSFSAFVVNGWDLTLDNNRGKTVGARASFLPYEYTAVSVTGVYGPEKDGNTDDQRFLLNADFSVQPARPLILGGEFNYGTEESSEAGGGDAEWIGGVFTAFLRLGQQFGLTVRYDVFDDTDGSRTGEARTLQSFTVAPMLFFRRAVAGIFSTIPQTSFALPEFSVRAGLRFNKSNDPFFATEDGLQRTQTQVVVEGVFVY